MQTTFAERHSGRPDELPLPWRIYSNDGLCFVQPLLLRGAATGHASSTELGRAAYTLFERCVVDKGTGGVAVEIGTFLSSFHVWMTCRALSLAFARGPCKDLRLRVLC